MAMAGLLLVLFSIYFLTSSSHRLLCFGDDRLHPGKPISVNQTLTSPGGTFALGFFSPGNSTGRNYVGIWYNNSPQKTVVWVANREAALTGPSGVLAVTADGNIALLDGAGSIVWSTNLTGIPSNTSAVLLDSGNLLLRDGGDNVLWQSFHYPTDTFLPTLQLWLDFKTYRGRNLVSWKDAEDPSPGKFSMGVDPKSALQMVIKEGSRIRWRGPPWDGRQTVVERDPISGSTITNLVTVDEHGIGVTFTGTGMLELARQFLDPSGKLRDVYWNNSTKNWSLLDTWPEGPCGAYEPCGPFGYCVADGSSPLCRCLEAFEPKHGKSWGAGDFSGGCVRRRPLAFDQKDGFLRAGAMKLPDNFNFRWNMTARQCRAECLGNWRCTAYAFANFSAGGRVGSRCLIWTGDLIDLVHQVNAGEDLYVRVAASELDPSAVTNATSKRGNMIIFIIPTVAVSMLLMGTCFYFLRRRLRPQGVRMQKGKKGVLFEEMRFSETLGSENDISELSLLDFNSIVAATNNFAMENKLGQGGFGPVYKGKLFQVHEVAIKRLSKCSGQGIEEFTTEVKLIAKLQHTNLVRLLGWCNHEEEKMLVYEYMPNGSLDTFIFDPSRSMELDWEKRLKIIEGIANGLLYLHHHSRLRVIHRDLKTSNILLDAAMNPKISDFGIARIFGGDQTEANTERIVGTYGYMSPEYAMDGLFSEKSDVFSYGVMLLEIITGKRTTGFYPYKESLNLLGYAWQLWKEGRCLELVDPSVNKISSAAEVSKCVQVGLLCVQEDAADRPCMSSIVFMLRKETSTLPSPKQPAFAIKKNPNNLMTSGSFSTAQEDGNK